MMPDLDLKREYFAKWVLWWLLYFRDFVLDIRVMHRLDHLDLVLRVDERFCTRTVDVRRRHGCSVGS